MDFPSHLTFSINQSSSDRRNFPESSSQNGNGRFPQTLEIESAFARLNVSGSGQSNQLNLRSRENQIANPQRNNVDVLNFYNNFMGYGGGAMSMGYNDDVYQRFLLESRRIAVLNEYAALQSSYPSNGFVFKNKNNLRSNLECTIAPQMIQEPMSVEDLRGKMIDFSKDQYGCRLLQKLIEDGSREVIDMVFFEVIDTVGELMVDPSANYVIQKLVEVCSEEQRTQILLMITRNEFQLVSICVNMHGTRAIQKLLQRLTTQQQISIVVSALGPRVVSLTKEMNGHHVILHFLKNFSEEDNKYLLNRVAANCLTIATDKSGCCILQQCVELSKGESRERLVREIIANAPILAENCYGNYVLQHLLEMRVPEIKNRLVRQLQGTFMSLSCNKYGSNVVEKCLKECGEQHAAQIIMELLNHPNASMLLLDPYGNFVIQKALSVSKGDVHNALFNLVWKNSHMLRSNMFGRKILAWFEKNKLQLPNMDHRNLRRYPYEGFLPL